MYSSASSSPFRDITFEGWVSPRKGPSVRTIVSFPGTYKAEWDALVAKAKTCSASQFEWTSSWLEHIVVCFDCPHLLFHSLKYQLLLVLWFGISPVLRSMLLYCFIYFVLQFLKHGLVIAAVIAVVINLIILVSEEAWEDASSSATGMADDIFHVLKLCVADMSEEFTVQFDWKVVASLSLIVLVNFIRFLRQFFLTVRMSNAHSTACVFLPEGDQRYGQHATDPEARSFWPWVQNPCYCHALYGSPQPWGCKWFACWIKNLERAVAREHTLVVKYKKGEVGQGQLQWPPKVTDRNRPGLGASQCGEVAYLNKLGLHYVNESVIC